MEAFVTLQPQDIASAVGVHGQVFTVVNDEEYFGLYKELLAEKEKWHNTVERCKTGITFADTAWAQEQWRLYYLPLMMCFDSNIIVIKTCEKSDCKEKTMINKCVCETCMFVFACNVVQNLLY